jgi:hypothetical protein
MAKSAMAISTAPKANAAKTARWRPRRPVRQTSRAIGSGALIA